MNPNQMLGAVQQAVTSSDFTEPGGYLAAKQMDVFYTYLRDERNPFLSKARLVRMPQKRMDIDKMHIGRPITRKATEGAAVTYPSEPQFGRAVRLNAEKVQASWERTRDIDIQQIEGPALQAHIMDAMMRRHGVDMEILGIQGDSSLSGTDELTLLLQANDGWDKLTAESHQVNAAGASPTPDMFFEALLRLPMTHQLNPGLRWIWNPATRIRLAKDLSVRQTNMGDSAITGNLPGPLGIPFIEASTIPRGKSVTGLADASPAVARAAVTGTFYITTTEKNLKVAFDGASPVTIDLSAALKNGVPKGPATSAELAKVINAALVADGGHGAAYANAAYDDGDGFLTLKSPITTASSAIAFNGGGAPSYDASGLFGFTVTPRGAAASGASINGTFIWLADPLNFLYGVVDRVAVHSFYQQDNDKDQVVFYAWSDFAVEEVDAVAKITNVIV